MCCSSTWWDQWGRGWHVLPVTFTGLTPATVSHACWSTCSQRIAATAPAEVLCANIAPLLAKPQDDRKHARRRDLQAKGHSWSFRSGLRMASAASMGWRLGANPNCMGTTTVMLRWAAVHGSRSRCCYGCRCFTSAAACPYVVLIVTSASLVVWSTSLPLFVSGHMAYYADVAPRHPAPHAHEVRNGRRAMAPATNPQSVRSG